MNDQNAYPDPTKRPKDEYKEIIDLISLPNSPVGIDAQYTHAIVITYLKQISLKLDELEARLKKLESKGLPV